VVLSLGAGVQSSVLYLMACEGLITPKPDYAIFADTQVEPEWVHEQLAYLQRVGNVPIKVVTRSNLGEFVMGDSKEAALTVPFWVDPGNGKPSPGRRQCTFNWKINVVHQAVREILGLKPRQHAQGRFGIQEWVGISTDEAQRMKPSRWPWKTTRWPLIEAGMSRADCLAWAEERGHPVPKKSSCFFCPYRQEKEWARWAVEEPELFEKACEFDEAIRHKGAAHGYSEEQFVAKSLRPLRMVAALPVADEPDHFGNECEGMCGV